MTIHRISLVAVCALIFALATPAHAETTPSDEDKAAASARFKKAVALYKSGDVRAALIEFRRAYKLAPTYHLLFNIGQASAELRDYVEAFNSFTQYLRDGGDNISDDRREMVERELERLAGYLARLRLTVSVDGAQVTVDGVAVGVSPLSEPLLLSAGRRAVVVTREGYAPWERSIDLAGEDDTDLEVTLISMASDRPERIPRKTKRRGLGAGFWVSAGLTAAFGLGTGAAGIMTLRAKSDQDDVLATVPTTQADIDDATDKTRQWARLTDLGLGLTAAAGIATLVFALRSGGETAVPDTTARSVDVIVSPGSVALFGRF